MFPYLTAYSGDYISGEGACWVQFLTKAFKMSRWLYQVGSCIYWSVWGGGSVFVTPWTVACTKLLHPWDFLGKSTGVGCRFLLQGIFPTQGSNPGLPHCRHLQTVRKTGLPISSSKSHIPNLKVLKSFNWDSISSSAKWGDTSIYAMGL